MIAVVPVRGGTLPLGADEAAAEAGAAALVAGEGSRQAAGELQGAATVVCVELGPFAPAAWATCLAPMVASEDVVVLPASPDGRDLAPRLAHELGWRLLAGAIRVSAHSAVLARRGGLVTETHLVEGHAVATLEPGARGFEPVAAPASVRSLPPPAPPPPAAVDPEVLEVVPCDPSTMDLAEATRIVAGGAGLGGPDPFRVLPPVAAALGATWGATRVAADAGWVPQDRFIGTTGVTVSARLYLALGISGAVQHVTGLGNPDHVIAVNTDASAPMMAMADLALVSDAPAVLEALARRVADMAAAGG